MYITWFVRRHRKKCQRFARQARPALSRFYTVKVTPTMANGNAIMARNTAWSNDGKAISLLCWSNIYLFVLKCVQTSYKMSASLFGVNMKVEWWHWILGFFTLLIPLCILQLRKMLKKQQEFFEDFHREYREWQQEQPPDLNKIKQDFDKMKESEWYREHAQEIAKGNKFLWKNWSRPKQLKNKSLAVCLIENKVARIFSNLSFALH